ncbi:MAG TPA: DUF418 domain-containing protein [Gammaproteobacteria bacterium]
MTDATTAGPITAAERIVALDVLRGFALLGILLVNIAFFAHPLTDPFNFGADEGSVNATIAWFTAFLAQGKFYPLFSLLFGLGFAVQLERARRRGGSFVPAYLRRLLVLLAIGVLHGVFVWAGDILTMYALLGFLLLLLGLGRPGWLLVFAITAFVVQVLIATGTSFMMLGMTACKPVLDATAEQLAALDPSLVQACSAEGMAQMKAGFAEAQAELTALREVAGPAYATGSYAEITAVRAREFGMMLSNMSFVGFEVLAMFLFGGWLGKRGIFSKPNEHKRFFRITLLLAVVVGLPLSAWFANIAMRVDYSDMFDPAFGWSFLLNLFAGPLLALGYASAFMLAMQGRASRWLGVLAPVGRMALTNYLAQSVICTLIFYSYGFGLMAEQPGALALLGIVVAVYVVEVFWSHWWLKRFAFGPAEWLWRALTYFQRPRMRLAESRA